MEIRTFQMLAFFAMPIAADVIESGKHDAAMCNIIADRKR